MCLESFNFIKTIKEPISANRPRIIKQNLGNFKMDIFLMENFYDQKILIKPIFSTEENICTTSLNTITVPPIYQQIRLAY